MGIAASSFAPLVTSAARCWRRARDERQPTQRRLYDLLRADDLGLLSPVFDSLLRLWESAAGRRFEVGRAAFTSADERMLLGLLDGSVQRRQCIRCTASAGSNLDCAICSTRIMLALTITSAAWPRARSS